MSEKTDFQIKLLNHCFDDIERFVVRLQVSAEAYRELGQRSGSRSSSDRSGMLGMRAKVPPTGDFIDVFAKFKLAFNLLGELQSVIRDPNAPEIVHFLFTPLSLIVAASKDPSSQTPDLATKVLSPLLSRNAKELLLHCLTSKETDLWMSMGDAWTTARNDWRGEVRPYYPQFSDGWQPSPQYLDDLYQTNNMPQFTNAYEQQRPKMREVYREPSPPRSVQRYREPSPVSRSRPQSDRRVEPVEVAPQRQYVREYGPPSSQSREKLPFDEEQQRYMERITRRGGKCYEVRFDRVGTNEKELTVKRGEALEVLDDGKNWWRVRNAYGGEGYVPYTHLKVWEASGPPIIIDNSYGESTPYPVPQPYYNAPPPMDYGGYDPYAYDPYGYDPYAYDPYAYDPYRYGAYGPPQGTGYSGDPYPYGPPAPYGYSGYPPGRYPAQYF